MLELNIIQWMNICINGLGLRSCSKSEVDLSTLGKASYSMDMNCKYEITMLPPSNWVDLLKGTLTMIKSFGDSSDRKLVIIDGSRGDSFEYNGCFPKCSSNAGIRNIIASTEISGKSIDDLAQWVIKNITNVPQS